MHFLCLTPFPPAVRKVGKGREGNALGERGHVGRGRQLGLRGWGGAHGHGVVVICRQEGPAIFDLSQKLNVHCSEDFFSCCV